MLTAETYRELLGSIMEKNATLVAVSKLQPVDKIRHLYDLGHRDFGENYVQELLFKKELLPADIRWHFIGHLQTNKVKQIAGEVQLIQGVDSLKLLAEIDKVAARKETVQEVLLQVHIAREETKYGWEPAELEQLLNDGAFSFAHVHISGLMGMASFTDDEKTQRDEFTTLARLYRDWKEKMKWQRLSMGMSGDFRLAMECGSNMVRLGSMLFGVRR